MRGRFIRLRYVPRFLDKARLIRRIAHGQSVIVARERSRFRVEWLPNIIATVTEGQALHERLRAFRAFRTQATSLCSHTNSAR